jgi:hypothetical protein
MTQKSSGGKTRGSGKKLINNYNTNYVALTISIQKLKYEIAKPTLANCPQQLRQNRRTCTSYGLVANDGSSFA